METAIPLASLISFFCYGTSLPLGNASTFRSSQLIEPAYCLDEVRRIIVLRAIEEACDFHGWVLYAAHVRMRMALLVVRSEAPPKQVVHSIKANAAHRLIESKLDTSRLNRWADHDEVKPLWKPSHLIAAVRFVVEEQGLPMAVCEYPLMGLLES